MKTTTTFRRTYVRPEQPARADTSLDCINMTIELRIMLMAEATRYLRLHLTPDEALALANDLRDLAKDAESRGYNFP